MTKYILKLYVLGSTPLSLRAIHNIQNLCETELKGRYELAVIDIQKNIQLAEDEQIFATPTLVKKLPKPLCRIIGDLTNHEKVLIGLDLLKK
jgi:circadian clock protein KaiB